MLGYKVNPIDIKTDDKGEPVFFNTKYCNVAMIAKKRSGKTQLIYNLLRQLVGKDTDIYVFCSTVNRDATWRQIVNEFQDKGNLVETYTSIYDTRMEGKRRRNVDNLKELIDSWAEEEQPKKDKKKKEEPKEEPLRIARPYEDLKVEQLGQGHLFHTIFRNRNFTRAEKVEPPKKRKRRTKKAYPQKILILDDMSEQLKNPMVASILKKNRHYRMCCIVSTQYPQDILPSARSQINMLMAWKGHAPNKVEVLRRICDVDLDEKQFYDLYRKATEKPYAFMFCDVDAGKIYENFDKVIFD
jgi:hypothetical protein